MRFRGTTIFVTGGAGFIGSAVIRHLLDETEANVVNIDKLTYAANLHSIPQAANHPRYRFAQRRYLRRARRCGACSRRTQPHCVMNLAAESHVDRSIDGPARVHPDQYRRHLHPAAGSAAPLARPRSARRNSASAFTISRPTRSTARSGPRACSPRPRLTRRTRPIPRRKASSDHLVRAWRETYGLADAGHQLLEQLRALSLPREADPAHDHQGSRRTIVAGLWRRRECARLALCRGSRPRAVPRRRARRRRRDLQYRRPATSAPISTSCETICRLLDELCAVARRLQREESDHLRRRPAGP